MPKQPTKPSTRKKTRLHEERTTKPLEYFEERRDDIVADIREMVEIESPSDSKQVVDRLGEYLAGKFSGLGGQVQFHEAVDVGDHLQVNFSGKNDRKPVLLLGHMDTVYPVGTLATMSCRVADGRLWGPGTLDMKSGIGLMLHSIAALQPRNGELPRPVQVLLVSDEEVGSDSSRHITEALARKSAAVLVLEPSYGLHGAVKTARKGVGEYLLTVTGVAAHSGLDFEKGQSAILELARQIEKIAGFTAANNRRHESSSYGAHSRGGYALPGGGDNREAVRLEAKRGGRRRRIRWQFHRWVGHSHLGRLGRCRRRGTCYP